MWRGGLHIEPEHFKGWSLGDRFYPVLYLLTRVGGALDWGNGLPLKNQLLGKTSTLEVHHIFPRKILYKQKHSKPEVNAVANFCLLTKDTNLQISAKPPCEYFPEVEEKFPGALASQWIPMDPDLWKIENYLEFLQARRNLLAEAANAFLAELLHKKVKDYESQLPGKPVPVEIEKVKAKEPIGGVDSEQEEEELLELNNWIVEQGLPRGSYLHELADLNTGESVAILDLAWPNGLQEELSSPVAVLLNEGPEVLELANEHGYRYFTKVESFKKYVLEEVNAQFNVL